MLVQQTRGGFAAFHTSLCCGKNQRSLLVVPEGGGGGVGKKINLVLYTPGIQVAASVSQLRWW